MARGWESKNIEAQQADRDQAADTREPMSLAEAAQADRRRTLMLARARALSDLANARSAEHRAMLEAAVRALDEQLSGL